MVVKEWQIAAFVLGGMLLGSVCGVVVGAGIQAGEPTPVAVSTDERDSNAPVRNVSPTGTPIPNWWRPTPKPWIIPSPTATQVDETGWSDLQVWKFCTASFQGKTTPEQFSLVVRIDEDTLAKENAKQVHKLVKSMEAAYPRVDVGLMTQTMDACEKWRDDEFQENQ